MSSGGPPGQAEAPFLAAREFLERGTEVQRGGGEALRVPDTDGRRDGRRGLAGGGRTTLANSPYGFSGKGTQERLRSVDSRQRRQRGGPSRPGPLSASAIAAGRGQGQQFNDPKFGGRGGRSPPRAGRALLPLRLAWGRC